MSEYTLTNLLDIKRDKTGIKIVRQWLYSGKEFNEIEIAKALSSTITHALIELEHASEEELLNLGEGYHVAELSALLNNLIQGRSNVNVIRRIILNMIEQEK